MQVHDRGEQSALLQRPGLSGKQRTNRKSGRNIWKSTGICILSHFKKVCAVSLLHVNFLFTPPVVEVTCARYLHKIRIHFPFPLTPLQYFSVKLSENMKASSFKKLQKVGSPLSKHLCGQNTVILPKISHQCSLPGVDQCSFFVSTLSST